MPYYPPSTGAGGKSPNVIVGECNTPPSGTPLDIQYDTWYDEAQADITATKTAVLATMGLTYAAGVFTTTEAGVWLAALSFEPIEAPIDQVSEMRISTSMIQGDPLVTWDDATFPLEAVSLTTMALYLASGQQFRATQTMTGTVTGTTPISYALITITRVL